MSSTKTCFVHRARPLALCAVLCLLPLANAGAADPRQSTPQAVYQKDRTDCMKGETNQERATCLREAGAALQEARRGRLANDETQFERNRLLRCESQPAADRADCRRLLNGEGVTKGSVAGGGVYRELTTTVP